MADNYRSSYSGENVDRAVETALGLRPGVEAGKGLSSNDYTTEEKTKLAGIEAGAQVNPDVSMFITRTVDDLVNYYLKSETYTKSEVNALIAGIKQFTYRVVDSLPTASADTMYIVYFVPSADPQAQNVKDEYITVEDNGTYSWELIGSTKIDLGDYAKKTGVYPDMISGASKAVALPNTTEEKFTYKTSGGQGPATIESIKGNSIVWNQLVRPSTIDRSISINGITFTDNRDGSYTLNGTATADVTSYARFGANIIKDHIYAKFGSGYLAVTGLGVLSKEIGVATSNQDGDSGFISIPSGVSFDNMVVYPMVIDLTQMFGAGYEPSTVAEFEALFHLPYYANNAGTILPFAAQALKTTGFNQYNHTTGTAKLLAGNEYQVSGTYTELTIDDEAVTLDSNGCFTPTKNCTLNVTGGNSSDTCVHLTWSGTRNGEYEPYEEHNLTINPATILDTNGDLIFPYGGMHGVGTAFDEMKSEADGFIHYGTRRITKVDLGTLEWTKATVGTTVFFWTAVYAPLSDTFGLISDTYIVSQDSSYATDKSIRPYGSAQYNFTRIGIRDSAYDNATALEFKDAMSGKEIAYEIRVPVTKELATPIPAIANVNSYGTMAITPENTDAPYTAPMDVVMRYAQDFTEKIVIGSTELTEAQLIQLKALLNS